jgi:cell division protein FtsW
MASRTVRTPFGDGGGRSTGVLLALLGLMLGGIILSLAASPPVAARLNLDAFHFVNRHILSWRRPSWCCWRPRSVAAADPARRAYRVPDQPVLVALTPFFRRRDQGRAALAGDLGVNVQPSEFLKPAFVILIAWLFAESTRRPEMPANTAALALLLGSLRCSCCSPTSARPC